MTIFKFKRQYHMENIKRQEKLIENTKVTLNRCMDADIAKLNRLNKILGNGIGLKIYTVTGGRNGH